MKKNGALRVVFIIYNVLSIIISAFLSVALVLCIISTALVANAQKFVDPDKIVTTITSGIDYSQIITENPDISQTLEESGISAEAVEEIMESDTFSDIAKIYTDDIKAILGNEELSDGITVDKINEIVNNNMDEIVGIVSDYVGQEVPKEELKQEIQTIVDTYAEDIVQQMPKPQDIQQAVTESVPQEVITIVGYFADGTVTSICIAVTVAIALLMFVLRIYKWRNLLWLSINCIVSAVFMGIITAAVSVVKGFAIHEIPESFKSFAESIISGISSGLLISTLIIFAVAAVLMTLFVIVNKAIKKKEQEQEQAEAEA